MQDSPQEWLEWLVGSDETLRHEATLRLGGLGPSDHLPLKPLFEGLSSPDDRIRFWCIVAVGSLGPQCSEAGNQLRTIASSDEAFGLRQAALSALASVVPAEPETKATILVALTDSIPFVRREALQALIKIPFLEAQDLVRIAAMVDDPDPAVASWAEVSLRNIARRTSPAA